VKLSQRYDSLFQFYAEKHDLDWLALKAQGLAESGLDPGAVSSAGAAGVMQFMLPTWIEWHGRVLPGEVVEQRTNPERSIELGAAYMAWLSKQLAGDRRAARAAYNWGIGRVLKAGSVSGYRFILPANSLPAETRAYLARIDQIYNDLRRTA